MVVEYPVALDSDYAVWRAFGNRYWPAVYIADAQGRIRHHQFGEGGYEECERVIQRLLGEAGSGSVADDLVSDTGEGFEAQADWANLESPETYLGYEQAQNFASPGGAALDEPRTLCRAGSAEAQPLGSRGRLDDRAGGERPEQCRRADLVPLPRPRRPSRHGAAGTRHLGAVPRARRRRARPAPLTGSTSTRTATEPWPSSGSTSWFASRDRSATGRSRSRSSLPASRPTCSPSARALFGPIA